MLAADAPLRVLLVDGSPAIRDLARRYLLTQIQVAGLDSAANCSEAAVAIQTRSPNVILVEYQLSDCAGPEAIAHLRRLAPTAGIVAIALFRDGADYRRLVQAAGADELVDKACFTTDLVPTIWQALRAHGQRWD